MDTRETKPKKRRPLPLIGTRFWPLLQALLTFLLYKRISGLLRGTTGTVKKED